MMAGVYPRFPAMAVKLKGEMEATKPSSERYRMRLSVDSGCSLMGWYLRSSLPKKALNRKKSIISAAASISACRRFDSFYVFGIRFQSYLVFDLVILLMKIALSEFKPDKLD